MFLRIVKAAGAKGVQHEYVRLVEAYRQQGKNKQRVVCNLGRKDVLAAHLDGLIRLLRGEPGGTQRLQTGAVEATGAWDWGPVLVARTLWRELGLDPLLEQPGRRAARTLAERALVLVANRLCAPTSEHGLARWLETDFVCDQAGRRWLPQWRDDGERRASRTPRVRVALRQLKQWYRTLDQLLARKTETEQALYLRLRDLFSLRVDLVFYDLTPTYFEGAGPPDLGAHGHSRDGKPRDPQVLVGVGMVDDWPIAHHVFRGNLRDATTVRPILEDLDTRFGLRRIVLVADRGMVTGDNLALLQGRGHGYLVGLNRRRNAAVAQYLAHATGPWTECPRDSAAPADPAAPKTYVQEVPVDEPGVRVFVVRSDERLAYERTERQKAMARVHADLEALRRRIAQGQLKAPEKVGAAAARILGRHHGHRYYGWEYTAGGFRFFEHPETLPREEALEGTYVLRTTEADLTPVQAVRLYKRLSEVERAFCHLKDVIELRPIYHQTDPRVAAHIFVAALAFLLHRALGKKLKAAGLDLSATEALQALRTVRVVEIQLGDGRIRRSVTRGTMRAARILSALGITDLHPPSPPKEVPKGA